ncbi:helix-turn-helix domain-containing protein [Bacillus cereus]|uniref:helix-turn-helix domain-containing protein n=1 Tax=Bacillus cereus TaxID=1396 RepID=UPI002405996A|nr:helix-turn-helix domain-containing protein [Bacillus cereus]MDF9503707.1 helix-turn-helix domain-containing protein [Bacillus cereus]MDF9597433.1 helix-turn-helix domain-containing protein [Bacillus cereus]MDF9609514.1 helix-turn-helix domain-containing protein [Bacillus cereus]MDF9660473.1 helix-turn-helix domain-containing protein [Bacillus cereus]
MSKATNNNEDMLMNEVTTGEPLEKGGYFVAYNYVMRNAMKVFDLTAGEYACLTMLFSYAGADKDKCFPSQATLAECLNVKDRAVRKYLDGLEKKGCLVIYNTYNNYNQKTKNVYDLSPCLHKIREIFCVNEEKTDISEGKRMVRKSRNDGPVHSDLSNSMDRSECTGGTGPNEPTTNNNIQITNKKDDDDIPNAPLSDEIIHQNSNIVLEEKQDLHTPKLSSDDILSIADMVSAIYKGKIQKRSFDSVLKKCINNYKKGTVPNFENYLITAIENKIQDLEIRRDREKSLLDILPKAKHRKKTVRTELAPDWLKEDSSTSTEDNGQAEKNLEDERKRLEEVLKKYKRD